MLQGKYVGRAGITPEAYYAFAALRDSATLDALLRLSHHSNRVVRGYAGWALADRAYPQLPKLFTRYLRQFRNVDVQHGCIVGRNNLANEFYARVASNRFNSSETRGDSAFYIAQLAQLDSIVLYHHRRSYLVDKAVSHNAAHPRRYNLIRKTYLRQKSSEALQALAEYRNPQDISLIKQAGYYGFASIVHFPDSTFWPLLTQVDLTTFSDPNSLNVKFYLPDYYRALACFRNKEAAAFLFEQYRGQRLPHPGLLALALTEIPDPVYDELRLRMWATDRIITLQTAQRLISRQPRAAAQAFAQGLLADASYDQPLALFSEYRFDDKVIPLMLGHLQQYDNDKLPQICAHNILTANFTVLQAFLNFAQANQLPDCKSAILERLQHSNSAYDLYALIEAALAYNDSAVRPGLIRLLMQHRTDWDKGNWSGNFRQLFAQHGIALPEAP